MKRLEAPKMYDKKTAAGMDLADVVRQAEVCGNELAGLYVKTHGLVGDRAVRVQDSLSRYLIQCNLVNALEGNEQRFDEAVRLMREQKLDGVRIPIKWESNEFKVECNAGRSYPGPIRHTSDSGRQAPVQV